MRAAEANNKKQLLEAMGELLARRVILMPCTLAFLPRRSSCLGHEQQVLLLLRVPGLPPTMALPYGFTPEHERDLTLTAKRFFPHYFPKCAKIFALFLLLLAS